MTASNSGHSYFSFSLILTLISPFLARGRLKPLPSLSIFSLTHTHWTSFNWSLAINSSRSFHSPLLPLPLIQSYLYELFISHTTRFSLFLILTSPFLAGGRLKLLPLLSLLIHTIHLNITLYLFFPWSLVTNLFLTRTISPKCSFPVSFPLLIFFLISLLCRLC